MSSKTVLAIPALAAVLFGSACGDATVPDTRAAVRFLNAIPDLQSGGFTSNGQFAAGSALAPGKATQSCMRVDAPSASFGFGAANAGGTALTGNPLATLNDQSMPAGGNFLLVAAGSATNPSLFLIDNSLQGSLPPTQAAVRFVNLAPGTGEIAHKYFAYLGPVGSTAVATNLAFGVPSAFASMASGSSTFSILRVPGHEAVVPGSTFSMQAGTVNTMAIVPTAAGGAQLINLASCP